MRSATLFKKRVGHRCFPVNFGKFLRTSFFTEHLWAAASIRHSYLQFRRLHAQCQIFPVFCSTDQSLREKCPKMEFFLVCSLLYSDRIWRFTSWSSVFSLNKENTDQKKLRIWTLFAQWVSSWNYCIFKFTLSFEMFLYS